jgi:hypothetical protein
MTNKVIHVLRWPADRSMDNAEWVSVSTSKRLVTAKATEPSPNRVSDKLDPSDFCLPKLGVGTTKPS